MKKPFVVLSEGENESENPLMVGDETPTKDLAQKFLDEPGLVKKLNTHQLERMEIRQQIERNLANSMLQMIFLKSLITKSVNI